MTLEIEISLGMAAIALASLLYTSRQIRESAKQTELLATQVRDNTKQQELDSFLKVYDINRKLISQGFWHPQLFAVLRDATGIDPEIERRCLQQWFAFFAVSQSQIEESIFKEGRKESLIRDFSNFISNNNARRYWQEYRAFYTDSFQEFANEIIDRRESLRPGTATQLESSG